MAWDKTHSYGYGSFRFQYIIEFQSHSVIGTESAFTIIIVHTSGRVDIFMV